MTTKRTAANVAALNDAFRKGQRPELGRIVITASARDAVAAWPLGVLGLNERVRAFNTFTPGNDPWGERDFGSFEHAGLSINWKIDYYDRASNLTAGAEDPTDPETCERVLTIMLAEDY